MVASTTFETGPGLWPALAIAQARDALRDGRIPRIVLIGPAGSEKSPFMSAIRTRIADRVSSETDAASDGTRFVDDAHLLSDADIAALQQHLDDEAAGLVIACRPWPRSAALNALIRRVEQSGPAIALGHVETRDVERALGYSGQTMSASCIRDLVEQSSSVTWLVRQAVSAHGEDPCTDPAHEHVVRAVGESIALRLDTIDPSAADAARRVSLGGEGDLPPATGTATTDALAEAYSDGLLLRGGHTIPLVRMTVRRTTPVRDVVRLLVDAPPAAIDPDVVTAITGLQNARLAEALLRHGDEAAARDADRALELYDAARIAGAPPATVAVRKARVAWDRGDVDEAASFLDAVSPVTEPAERDEAIRILGAAWASRGFLLASAATYRAESHPEDPVVRSHGAVAAFGVGDAAWVRGEVREEEASRNGFPTTLRVAHTLLLRGLLGSLASPTSGALDDLIRASETYGESRETGAAPELPAVLAALAAIHTGELDTAASILSDALMAEHGGAWARPRLLLWAAWVAVHLRNPEETAQRLSDVDASVLPLSGREVLLRNAVMLAYVRRYGSVTELRSLWERVRDDIRHVEVDLYAALPVCEFVTTSVLFDDRDRTAAAFDTVSAILRNLGQPPLWSSHILWAAHQRAIIEGDSHEHGLIAKALANAARHSRIAATMSAAAAEWARGKVDEGDVDRIERIAGRLADAGFSWDAARLVLTLSARTRDRRAAARLTAFARGLDAAAGAAGTTGDATLTDRGPLTAREREVATLVLNGMTYAEIGETIFISPRTAEHHMARIRRRLGATSRTDLINKLQDIVGNDDGT